MNHPLINCTFFALALAASAVSQANDTQSSNISLTIPESLNASRATLSPAIHRASHTSNGDVYSMAFCVTGTDGLQFSIAGDKNGSSPTAAQTDAFTDDALTDKVANIYQTRSCQDDEAHVFIAEPMRVTHRSITVVVAVE